jgi:hypothetical protein
LQLFDALRNLEGALKLVDGWCVGGHGQAEIGRYSLRRQSPIFGRS